MNQTLLALTGFAGWTLVSNTYSLNLIPNNSGLITVDIPAGVCADAAGNSNIAATQFSITYDSTSPTVTITSSESSPTSNSQLSSV